MTSASPSSNNQVTEPASIVFWNLGQAGSDYTFLKAYAALELAGVGRLARVCRQSDWTYKG